jgi:hypothetical protein
MDKETPPYEGRLKRIVLAYMPVAIGGAVATFAYDVGAHPGSRARDDIVFRGSPLVPPLLMPVALLGADYLVAKRGPVGIVATAVMGFVGLGFIGGTTFNLPNDLDAARAAGSPEWASYLTAAIHLPLGVALASQSILALRQRRLRAALFAAEELIHESVRATSGPQHDT